jgi:myosin heavy subunit
MDCEQKCINDLATLPNLNEEIILNHLKLRYKQNLIYVSVYFHLNLSIISINLINYIHSF